MDIFNDEKTPHRMVRYECPHTTEDLWYPVFIGQHLQYQSGDYHYQHMTMHLHTNAEYPYVIYIGFKDIIDKPVDFESYFRYLSEDFDMFRSIHGHSFEKLHKMLFFFSEKHQLITYDMDTEYAPFLRLKLYIKS